VISPLVHIINSCILKCILPEHWKTARVCPIPKINNPTTPNNFRSISILPILSKVYEKRILNQLVSYVDSKIYNDMQSGFRKGHSTTLLLKFRDDIRRAMNKSEIMLTVLIDYSTAFERSTIRHWWRSSFPWNSLKTPLKSYWATSRTTPVCSDQWQNLEHVTYCSTRKHIRTSSIQSIRFRTSQLH